MRKPFTSGTRWFSLSDSELLVLVAGTGIALLAVCAARAIDLARFRDEITINQRHDVLPLPARLNVNDAPDYELAMLPGIGMKTARAMVEYRDEHGPFQSLDELAKVKGIGPKTIQEIRPHAMCGPPDTPAGPGED